MEAKQREQERLKKERQEKRAIREQDRKSKISLMRDMTKQQRIELAIKAYERRQSFIVDDGYSKNPKSPIRVVSEKCSIEKVDKGWRCTARSNFPTVQFQRGVKSGRWYFEIFADEFLSNPQKYEEMPPAVPLLKGIISSFPCPNQ